MTDMALKKAANNMLKYMSASKKEKSLVIKQKQTSGEENLDSVSENSYTTTVSNLDLFDPESCTSKGNNLHEDDSPCGKCEKNVTSEDEALLCELCEHWFHIKCEKITKAQYRQQQKDSAKSRFHWFCTTCDKEAVPFL